MAHMKFKKMLFIGSGNITGAVACGLVITNTVPAEFISVYNRNDKKFDKFKKLGITTYLDINEATKDAEIIFLAVKPNVVSSVMKELAVIDGLLERVIVVSFAASVPMEYIEKSCDKSLAVIRTMPSTPILVGEGVLAVCKNERVSEKDFREFCRTMSGIAYVTNISESEMNPIISVQGSSPAYVYLFVKSMLDAAEKQGIDPKSALPLILKTIKGAVTMIEKSDSDLDTLISNVASPNGTTLAALNSFNADDFSGAIERAMEACTNRANEITSEL